MADTQSPGHELPDQDSGGGVPPNPDPGGGLPARAEQEHAVHPAPRDPDQLTHWLRDALEVTVPRTPIIDGHAAPFDYLQHAFFEGEYSPPGAPIDSIVWANRGGGKTFLGALATTLDLVFKPGIQVRILAGSLEQAGRMHAHLRALFQRPALAPLVEGRITDKRLRLANGSDVELLAQSQAAVRGTRVQKLRCDEVELFTREVWDAAQLTTRSVQCGDVQVRGAIECFSTMHRPFGLMHRLVAEALDGKRRLFRWGVVDVLDTCGDEHQCRTAEGPCPLWDECAGRAKERDQAGEPPGYLPVKDAIVMKSRVALVTWEAEMLCQRPSRTDTVLPEFDLSTHVVDRAPDAQAQGGMWVGGMDFGFRAPTVFLWAFRDPEGVLWIIDERVARGIVLDEHLRAILDSPWPVPSWVGIDPAGMQVNDQTGRTDAELMRGVGLVPKSRRFGIREGLLLIRARLDPASGRPRLLVHRRCASLIESLVSYHYPPDRPEVEQPVKDGSDHAVDALRYLVVNLDRPYRTRHTGY